MKRKWIITTACMVSILAGYLYFEKAEIKAEESISTYADGPTTRASGSLITYPNVNLVDSANPGAATPIPGEYATLFRITPRLTYTVSGATSEGANYARFDKRDITGNNFVQLNKVAIYKGGFVDLRATIESYTSSTANPTAYIYYPTSTSSNAQKENFLRIDTRGTNAQMRIRYDFFKSGTTTKIPMKAMWNVKRLNYLKGLTIDSDSAFLQGLYTYSNSEIIYSDVGAGTTRFVGTSGGEKATQEFTYLFNSDGSMQQTIDLPSGAVGYLKYETSAMTRIILPPPQILGETNEDQNKIDYTVVQDMPEQSDASFYPKQYTMYMNADEIFDLSQATVKVTDMNGANTTSKFTITKDIPNNRFVVTVPASTLSSASFVNNSYEFQITSKLTAGVDKEKYYQSDGYLHIPMTVYNVTGDGQSEINEGIAKTKLGGSPTADPVPQEVMVGSSTQDLDPADLVSNLKGVFASETVSVIGFDSEKTFSTVGNETVIVVIKGDKSGLTEKISVPITVKQFSNPEFMTKVVSEVKQSDGSWKKSEQAKPLDEVRFTITSELTNDLSRWQQAKLYAELDALYKNVTPVSAEMIDSTGNSKNLGLPVVSQKTPFAVVQTADDDLLIGSKGSILKLVYTAQVDASASSKLLKTKATPKGLNPDNSVIAESNTEHLLNVLDVEPPIATAKLTKVTLNDAEAIIGSSVDLKGFFTTVSDNVSPKEKITAKLLTTDIPSLVSTVGKKTIKIRLTDEAGNSADYDTFVYVVDDSYNWGEDGIIKGTDFRMDYSDWPSKDQRPLVVTKGKVEAWQFVKDEAGNILDVTDVTADETLFSIDISKVTTAEEVAHDITLKLKDTTKVITVTFNDRTKPTGIGKLTFVDLGDNASIENASDYTAYLTDWSDNVSAKDKIAVTLKPGQNLVNTVSKVGPASFVVILTDEAGNAEEVTVPIFVKNDEMVTSNKYVVDGRDFSIAAKDYPTSEEAILTMIREKGKLALWEIDDATVTSLDASKISIDKGTLPGPAAPGTPVASGDYQVTLSYGEGPAKVEKNIKVTIIKSVSTVNVEFVDDTGKKIHETVPVSGNIGGTIDLTKNSDVKAVLDTLIGQNYQIQKTPIPEDAIPVNETEYAVQYFFSGTLFIYSAPQSIDFGLQDAGIFGVRVEKPAYDKELIIWDNRTKLTNWTLDAKLESYLTSNDGEGAKILPEAIRYRTGEGKESEIILNNENQPIVEDAHTTTGQYDVSDKWKTGERGFKLDVPAGAVRELGKYKATIVWTVGATP